MPPIFSKKESALYAINSTHKGQPRTSPCEISCPLGNPIQKMQQAVMDGDITSALQALHARNPFPGITSRTCPHPCETKCNRGQYDESISIRAIERYIADNGEYIPFEGLAKTGKSIAIVGSGPAGMACAYFAALLGHSVTIFESSPVVGGAPRHAIPDFRLPKSVVEKEIGQILQLGVVVHTNTKIGRDIEISELMERFDACLLAVGNTIERTLPIEGHEHMTLALSFLQSSNLTRTRLDNLKVAVLGGGGVALDCAFTARRVGAEEVHIICLEAADSMRAPVDEIEQAHQEAIHIHNNKLAQKIIVKNGKIEKLNAQSVQSFSFNEKGQLEVEIDFHAPLLDLDVDIVICASGLLVDLSLTKEMDSLKTQIRGFVEIDILNNSTSVSGLFAAGECAIGPSSVAASIADGRKAAFGIHAFLCNAGLKMPMDIFFNEKKQLVVENGKISHQHEVDFSEIINIEYYKKENRQKEDILTFEKTWFAFEELNKGLNVDAAMKEASRCMQCGQCKNCGECVASCPGLILEQTDNGPYVKYPDECWHCGCCRLACSGGCIEFKFPLHTMI